MQGLKELSDTELLSEAASQELEQNNLEAAQRMYTELLQKLDAVLAPPYPVTYVYYLISTSLSTNMPSGLLQDPAEHLEVHLDEVRQPADHGRGAEASHPSRRGLRYCGLIRAHCAAWKYIYTLFTFRLSFEPDI